MLIFFNKIKKKHLNINVKIKLIFSVFPINGNCTHDTLNRNKLNVFIYENDNKYPISVDILTLLWFFWHYPRIAMITWKSFY
jgi:hypothetical protein